MLCVDTAAAAAVAAPIAARDCQDEYFGLEWSKHVSRGTSATLLILRSRTRRVLS